MKRRRWLRWTAAVVLVFVAAGEGLSWSLARGWLRGYLTSRLARTFGRPVEVSQYDFSVWRGLHLQAHLITVGEEPRFGQEYFLRAEDLSASLRWRSLLRGRIEFSTFAFSRPSLNLVRAADGRWNLEDWLPPAAGDEILFAQSGSASRGGVLPRLYRIEIDNGRINIKRGVDKLPFALVGVTGRVAEESPGRWRIDLEARPARAAAILQEVGTLKVSGLIGGTSTRLRPANLEVSWQEGSLPDALRLWRGYDYGIRGRLGFDLTAHSQGQKWSFTSTVRADDVHRWDLPLRPDSPAVNLQVEGDWWPQEARVQLTKCVLEAPRSSVRASGLVDWARASPGTPPDVEMRIVSPGIEFSDLMAWYRAFRPGVAEDLLAEGLIGGAVELAGWPLQIERGALAIAASRVQAPGLGGAVRMNSGIVRLHPSSVEFSPLVVTLPKQAGTVRLDAKAQAEAGWDFRIDLAGTTERAQDVHRLLTAFGAALSPGWSVEGPATLQASWQGRLRPFAVQSTGTIDLRAATWRPLRLNHPVSLGRVRVELASGRRRVTVTEAHAFGTRWSGWIERRDAAQPWEFDLSADRLDAGELDDWLRSQQRQTLFGRFVTPLASPTAADDAWWGSLRGRGRLQVNELSLSPFALQRLRASVELDGPNVRLSDAQAGFYGGTVRGSFRALFSARPAYRAELLLERVNLALLGQTSPALRGRYSGTASGDLSLTASGLGREDLESSLEGRGRLEVRNAADQELNWLASFAAGGPRPGPGAFQSASSEFRFSGGKIDLDQLRLVTADTRLEGAGSIDFSRVLSLRVRALAPIVPGKPPVHFSVLSGQLFRLTGPLSAPQIQRLETGEPLR